MLQVNGMEMGSRSQIPIKLSWALRYTCLCRRFRAIETLHLPLQWHVRSDTRWHALMCA